MKASPKHSRKNMVYNILWNLNENLNLAVAKEYIINKIGNEMINVMYGKKQ